MADNTKTHAAELLRSHDRYVRFLAVLAAVAAIVAGGVALALRQRGEAKVHEITVLDCQYTGNGAHTHNADCYDAEGNLVCPLPERALHIHDASCYTEERTLICGQEETPGHTHTEECYDEEGNLTCGQEETPGHTHTDECYEVTQTLTCGQEEVTEEHVHGPSCFTTITVPVDDEEAAELTAAAEAPSREQTITQELRRKDENDNEYVYLRASVVAPAGTLPANAALKVTEVSAADVKATTPQIEALIARELGADTAIKRTDFATLALTDADGNEVEPSGTVEVKLSTALIRESDELVIVQLPDADRGTTEPAIVSNVSLVNWDDADTSVGNEDTLMFWTNEQLSPYAIVEVDTAADASSDITAASDDTDAGDQPASSGLIEITLGEDEDEAASEPETQPAAVAFPEQSFEGTAGNVQVVVKAPQGALPAGTTMQVKPVDVQQAVDTVNSTMPGIFDDVAAVDIVFLDPNGTEVQPLVPIKVTMTNTAATSQGQPIVLHVDDQGNATVVKETEAPSPADEVAFEANSFSVYIMAVKKLQQTMTASDGRTYEISVTYTEDAGIPDGAELVVKEVTENDSNFSQVFNRAKDAATSQYEDATVTSARFFDISIMKDGATLEPLAPVEVNIVLTSGVQATETTSVVHLKNSRKAEVVDAAIAPADAEAETGVDATFTAESFSIFGVIEITIEKDILASDGQNYHVTVTYGSDAGVPAGATLDVTELLPSEAELAEDAAKADPNAPRSLYEEYLFRVEDALGLAGTSPSYARLFDIRIVDRTGRKVEINAPVSVRIELADKSNDDDLTQVVHFADRASEPDVLQGVNVEGEAVSFEAEGFSVYAIVDAPDVSPSTGGPVTSIDEFVENPNTPLYLSLNRSSATYYITNSLNTASDKQCFYENTAIASAALWTFVPTSEGASTYWISTSIPLTTLPFLKCMMPATEPSISRSTAKASGCSIPTAVTACVSIQTQATLQTPSLPSRVQAIPTRTSLTERLTASLTTTKVSLPLPLWRRRRTTSSLWPLTCSCVQTCSITRVCFSLPRVAISASGPSPTSGEFPIESLRKSMVLPSTSPSAAMPLS